MKFPTMLIVYKIKGMSDQLSSHNIICFCLLRLETSERFFLRIIDLDGRFTSPPGFESSLYILHGHEYNHSSIPPPSPYELNFPPPWVNCKKLVNIAQSDNYFQQKCKFAYPFYQFSAFPPIFFLNVFFEKN